MSSDLTLLHTNDLHGRLTPQLAERLAAVKAESAPCLLLDSGDAVECGNIGFNPLGQRAHAVMAQAGFDAVALGNREFHFRPWPQRCKLRRASFPVLSANLTPQVGRIQPWVLLQPATDWRVLLLGLTVPMVTETMRWARAISPSLSGDAVEAARTVLGAQSGPPADAVVCLSHLGFRADCRLAAEVEGIDVILGAHSHTRLDPPQRVGSTLICQNAPYAATYTRVTMSHTSVGRPTVRGEVSVLASLDSPTVSGSPRGSAEL